MCFSEAKTNKRPSYFNVLEDMAAGIAKKPKRIESVVVIVPTDEAESAERPETSK